MQLKLFNEVLYRLYNIEMLLRGLSEREGIQVRYELGGTHAMKSKLESSVENHARVVEGYQLLIHNLCPEVNREENSKGAEASKVDQVAKGEQDSEGEEVSKLIKNFRKGQGDKVEKK